MNGFKILLKYFISAVIAGFIACTASCDRDKSWPPELQTVPEKTAYEQTSTHADVMNFINTLREKSSLIHVEQIAESAGGKYVPLVVLADPLVRTPEEAENSGKPVVYLQGNIHGGEVDGKEALLEIMREILTGREKSLLSDQILLICPIFNPDGNDNLSEATRSNDNGPAMAGERENGEGYDLNRDGIKAEAVEIKGLLENVILKWDPVLLVDLHTTNGSWHGYSLTYAPPYNPVGHQGPADYLMDTMLPEIREKLDDDYDMKTFLYGLFSGYPPTQWFNYSHQPRFIVNYMGLRNRMAVLSESFAHDPFEKRILSSRLFVTAIIEYVNEHGRKMVDITGDADDETVSDVSSKAGDFEKGVEFDAVAQDEPIDLLVYEQVPVTDPVTGEESLQLTENIITISGVDIVNKYVPAKTRAFPRGYLFPAELTGVAEKLMEHGINVEILGEPVKLKGEEFIITAFSKKQNEFQKHFLVTLEGYFEKESKEFPAGTYRVDLAQPLANLAFYMLEPESDDGMAKWNFFDDYLLEHGVETGEVPFPVFKYFEEE